MDIRPGTEADADYVFQANNRLLAMHQKIDTFYKPLEKPVDSASVPKERLTFIAEHTGIPVGSVTGVFFSEPPDRQYPFALLQQCWVDEAYRAQGVGRALLAAFEEAVRERGGMQVEVMVDIRNALGREFWIAEGFETYQEKRAKRL